MNDLMQISGGAPQLSPVGGMDAVTRAEIDIQISTAHAYPRSLTRVAQNVTSLVTMSRETAEGCIFSLPRGGKPIVGPSIRLAEILFSQWGNCTGGSRIVDVNRREGYIEAEGVFHDLQSNSKSVRRVRRSIKGRNGNVYSDDMIVVTGNAAGAIAFRNAVLAGVPRAVWGEAYTKAEQLIRGDIKTLPERRDNAMKAMAAFGLSQDDMFKILEVDGLRDVGLDQLLVVSGLHNALKEGETSAEKLLAEAEARQNPKSATKEVDSKKAESEIMSGLAAMDAGTADDAKPKSTKPKAKNVDRTPPKPAEKPKEEPKAEAKKETVDPETGEVTDAPDEGADAKDEDPAVSYERAAALAKSIMNDLDQPEVGAETVLEFYKDQLAEMEKAFPELHEEIMDVAKGA